MERNEISIHEVKVYEIFAANKDRWMSNSDIAKAIKDVSPRTIRLHTKRFVDLGILDAAEVFPAHRYRWSSHGARRNKSYSLRLDKASEIFK